MMKPELDGPEVSRTLLLNKDVWEHLIDVGVTQGHIPNGLAEDLPHGLDAGEVDLVRTRVAENVETKLPLGRDSERRAREISQNALVALGITAVENRDFITSGSVVQILNPGWQLWRIRALSAKLHVQIRQTKAMKVL